MPCCSLQVADLSEDRTSYLSKIKRVSCILLYLTKRRAMKCSSKPLQVLIQSGLSNDWTAMPLTIATVTSLLPMKLVLDSSFCFSRMCINVLLKEQCIIVTSEANRNLGTTVNSESDSLFNVNIWVTLANHHWPHKQRPVLFQLHHSFYCLNFDHLPITFPCL